MRFHLFSAVHLDENHPQVLLYIFLNLAEVEEHSDTKINRNKGVHKIRF